MAEYSEVYNKVTRHQEDLKNGERKAKGRLYEVCNAIQKQKVNMHVASEKRELKKMDRIRERETHQDEIITITTKVAKEMIAQKGKEEKREKFIEQINVEIQYNKEENIWHQENLAAVK